MKVNFNNLRKQIGNDYNGIYLLAEHIEDQSLKDSFEIILDTMRAHVATLLCCESGDEGIQAVDYKLFPYDDSEGDE